MSCDYNILKKFLDDSNSNREKLATETDTDAKKQLLFEIYANLKNLEDELKHERRYLRGKYKIIGLSDRAVNDWMQKKTSS